MSSDMRSVMDYCLYTIPAWDRRTDQQWVLR